METEFAQLEQKAKEKTATKAQANAAAMSSFMDMRSKMMSNWGTK